MKLDLNLPVKKFFVHFAGYSKIYSTPWVKSSQNEYAQQVDVQITLGSDCAKTDAHGDVRIEDKHHFYDGYEQYS